MKKKMRKKSAKTKSHNFKDILDSDDELPTEYIDLPFVPAYQIDNRFEHIEEKNVDRELNQQIKEKCCNSETVVASGYLNKKDTFCIKSLNSTADIKALKWFFKFLMLKDMHSKYTFLTTCLVPRYDQYYYCSENKINLKDCKQQIRYKVVATK